MKDQRTTCQSRFVHQDTVETVLASIPREEELYDLADFFRIFADATRIKILLALSVKEMCVCDLSELLHVSQSAMSHQLKTLRQVRLVSYRKDGKTVFYALKDEHVRQILDIGREHMKETV